MDGQRRVEIEPLEKANKPPATPRTAAPAMAKATHCTRAHVDADRLRAQRRESRAGPQRVPERRERASSRSSHALPAALTPASVEPEVGGAASRPARARPHSDHASIAPAGPPSTHWNATDADDLREGEREHRQVDARQRAR